MECGRLAGAALAGLARKTRRLSNRARRFINTVASALVVTHMFGEHG
jgi:hypothetical protein